ncbi:ComEC/Rec2 family competence protein [Arthrobacter mobilis]|uniref:MBL fold metallo-hydrolase n=1 Tax=Arthrobacter mobilis TaxID=2724944 RepID=A0A7X6HBI2_9MICC|nr:ComEC/Rec2 family competence protein [Arthrobacter mobilis]NKX54041.1 MBL fold metallo-hydrolase [Arthrobacter mobilis]
MSRPAPWRRFAEAATAGLPDLADVAGGVDDPEVAGGREGPAAARGPSRVRAWAARLRAAGNPGPHPLPAGGRNTGPLDFRLAGTAAVCWAAALGLPHAPRGTALVLAALLFAAVLAILLRMLLRPEAGSWRTGLCTAILVLAGAVALLSLILGVRQAERLSGPIRAALDAGATVTVRMVALSDAAKVKADGGSFDGSARYQLRAEILEATAGGQRFEAATPVLVIAGSSWAQARYGDALAGAGKLVRTEEPGAVDALLIVSTGFHRTGSPPAADAANALREGFMDGTGALPPDARALLSGMVLGDRSSQPEDLANAMRAAGLTHLLAVSGANCSYVLGFVYLLSAACRLPRPVRGLLALAALAGFILLVRPEPSVLRAASMGSIGVFALLAGRRRASLAFLCLAVIVLLLADPWLAASYGFLLSVLATLGLVLFGERCSSWLQRFLPKLLADAVSLPLAAQVFCSPVLVLLQPELPLYSVPANVLVTPVVPAVTIIGMAAVLLFPVWPWAAAAAVQLAGWLSLWVAGVARTVSGWPAAVLAWPEGAPGAVLALLAGLLLLSLLCLAARLPAGWPSALRAALRLRQRFRPDAPAPRAAGGNSIRRTAVRLLALGAAAAVLSGLAAVLLRSGGGTAGPGWTVAACDVGQGDGLAVNTGGGSAIVVDTGPEPALMDACLDRLGVSWIEVLVLTHMHLDHYGGLAGALDGRGVGRVLVGSARSKLPEQVTTALAAAGAAPERGAAGMSGTAGSARWQILWPVPGGAGAGEENDASLVLSVQAGTGSAGEISMLLTGDLEAEAAGMLLMRLGRAVPAVDVLKISHHGARNGGTRLIEALQPKAAVISVGRGNDYGHPAPEILAALQQNGVPVFRTDVLGTITVAAGGGRLQVAARR